MGFEAIGGPWPPPAPPATPSVRIEISFEGIEAGAIVAALRKAVRGGA